MTLQGKRILITRPAHQAQPLQALLHAAGAIPLLLPTLGIREVTDKTALLEAMQHFTHNDIVIFTSANAVDYAVPLLRQQLTAWPPAVTTLAIGSATKQHLQQQHWPDVITPDAPFNSEGLLALPVLQQVHGRTITLFCGINPRPLLSDTLIARGARVRLAYCYERYQPEVDVTPWITQLQHHAIDAIISTSMTSLMNLFSLFGRALYDTPIVVISPAMAEALHQLGYAKTPIIAPNATDSSIMSALTFWYEESHNE